MGIQGLLPLLKSIQRPTELKKFSGETLGVDTYGWLHKGAIGCAMELAQGKPTRKYVDFAMHRVRMLKHFGITPYMVFDGDYLPSKADTEASREKRREESRKAGLELLKAGKPSQAYAELQKAIDVTPEMARHLIEELKKAGIPYVVAPYEADPQLVYLEQQGLISGIVSEDSDLLVFGAKRLLTKLDQHGQCIEINRRDFCACREISLTGWTDTEFRQMAILSGCDYLDSVPNLGLKTAYRMIRKHKTPEKAIRMLQFDGKYRFPADYSRLFRQAELTFLYQWVFCPKTNQLVNFTEPGPDINLDEMSYIGSFVEHEFAKAIATGDVNPITKQQIVISTLPSPRKRTASGTARNTTEPKPVPTPPEKPIDSYFKGHRRIPLGEMEPNCFSVDPARVAALTDRGNRPIVFPLPRPYLDESGGESAPSRTYINRPASPSRRLRRRTEPLSSLLGNGGYSLSSGSRRQTVGTGLGGNSSTAESVRGGASSRPPKKARLCDDASESVPEKSKFFPTKAKRTSMESKDQGYLKSDDSVEEALRDLPDIDGWKPKGRMSDSITVFQEAKQLSHTPNVSNTATARSRKSLSSVNTPCESTPALSTGSSRMSRRSLPSTQASTTKSTPATPAMTPLQRLGAQAMKRNKQPTSPSVVGRHVSNRLSKGRPSIDSIPLNPSFVPLPAVDMDEVEALHKPMGSEDLLIPNDENDNGESDDDLDNNCPSKPNTLEKKMDLARFIFK